MTTPAPAFDVATRHRLFALRLRPCSARHLHATGVFAATSYTSRAAACKTLEVMRSAGRAMRRAAWIGARAVQVLGDTEGLPTRAELEAAGP